jgi:hypothetical protein
MITEKQVYDFLKLFKQGNIDECWEWLGSKYKNNYGQFHRNGIHAYSHRVSYEYFICSIPEGMLVLHKCDNPSCVNPNHLFLGTQKDNMQDMIKKGRQNIYDRSGEKNPMFGKHQSKKTCKKIGISNSGEKSHFFGKHPDHHGEKNPSFGKDHSGEKNGNSKLIKEQIIEIRNSNLLNKELAKIFNVKEVTIYKIKRYEIWKSIK